MGLYIYIYVLWASNIRFETQYVYKTTKKPQAQFDRNLCKNGRIEKSLEFTETAC